MKRCGDQFSFGNRSSLSKKDAMLKFLRLFYRSNLPGFRPPLAYPYLPWFAFFFQFEAFYTFSLSVRQLTDSWEVRILPKFLTNSKKNRENPPPLSVHSLSVAALKKCEPITSVLRFRMYTIVLRAPLKHYVLSFHMEVRKREARLWAELVWREFT